MRFPSLLARAALVTVPSLVVAQGAPSTDIHVAPLVMTNGQRTVGAAVAITRHKGYDNQPSFAANGDAVYYTSQRDGQTDIFSYNLRNNASRPLFDAPITSEYSAALTPDRRALSVIRVERDSTQRLWRFPLDGSDPSVLLPAIKPVGYHAWATDSTVLIFVLGQPATLQYANVRTGTSRVMASGIGRWLAKHPTRAVIGVVRKPAGQPAMIAEFDISTQTLRDLAPVLEGTEDYAWTPDGALLGGKGCISSIPERGDGT
jgi:Tol biopolymer transport system component